MVLIKYQNFKSFKQWLMQFIDKDDRYGDLARDVKSDDDFPSTDNRYDIEWYLTIKCNACNDAVITFQSAFDDYENYVRSLQIINKKE